MKPSHSPSRPLMLGLVAATVFCCFFLSSLKCARAAAQDQPRVLGSLSVQVDKSSGAGTSLVVFRNDAANPMEVSLSARPVSGGGASGANDAQVRFGAVSDNGPGDLEYKFTLNSSASARVKIFVTNVWGTSRIETDLLNGSVSFGKLAILPSAMNISLVEPAADKELNLTDSVPARIILKNDDPVPYELTFRLIVGGRQLAGHDFHLSPQGTSVLEFVPNMTREWTSPRSYVPAILTRLQEIFKPDIHKGDTVYLYQKRNGSSASSPDRIIPLSTSFNYFSLEWRTALNYLLIIGILIVGGITSLTFGHSVPNLLERLKVLEQLNALARSIANLSSNIGSRLAVLLRLERSRLRDLLRSRSTISPDFETVLQQCKDGVAKLTSRVAMCQQMDIVTGKLWQLARSGAPPSQIEDISRSLQQASETLMKVDPPDPDLQETQKSIAAAAASLDSINRPNPDFGKALAQRVRDACTNVLSPLARSATFTRVNAAVPGPANVLQAVPAAVTEIDASLYTSVDTAVWKILIIREYVEFADGTNDPPVKSRLQARENRLTSYLNVKGWKALCDAKLLLQEMEQDLYPERLQEALTANPVEAQINMEPAVAYEEEPLEFSIRFSNDAINSARARDEWVCKWTFGDRLQGEGWLVAHYFVLPRQLALRVRKKQCFDIAASFEDASGKQVVDPATGKPVLLQTRIEVQPSRLRSFLGERAVAEAARLGVVLLIAVFGLVAGVKDQLLKLDVLPGLVAVFLAGYAVDALKNLMSPNKSS